MKLLISFSLFFFLFFFKLNISHHNSNTESSISFMNAAFAGSCSDSTADACSFPSEGNGDGYCRACSFTGGGGAPVGGAGGGGGGGGGGNGSNGEDGSNRDGGNQNEGNPEMCGIGKTRPQIHSAYVSTIAKLNLVRSDVRSAIAFDTVALRGMLARYRVPKHIVDWAPTFYAGATGLSLKIFSDRAEARVEQEYQAALATCP